MLLLILIILVTENVYLAKNEKVEPQEFLDSTHFKNALAKELLKKKLLNLESARQQDSLAQFLRKGEKNPVRGKPNFNVDDDPSRKQAQMANSFIASSNLLFGTKSQRIFNTANKPANKEAMLDMQSLRHSFSGYNEEGVDFPSSKDESAAAVRKRSFSKKGAQDPISCYLTEPKKVTCMHKDIIYKIQLPSSDVADDEIGRIVESIYRAVEGNRAPNGKIAIDDSYKRKRASDDYIKSLFLNNFLLSNHPKTALMPAYNGNNAIYLPLLIPVSQSKIEAAKAPLSYYPGLLVDPKLQLPNNMSVNSGADALNNIGVIGKNVMVDNGYGQYVLPESYFMPASNLRQRSDNITAEEEKRRNWLALMATNGYVAIDRGVNAKLANLAQPHLVDSVQSLSEDKEALGSNNKLGIAEAGEHLDKLFNNRQGRDTYYLRRQLRRKPYDSVFTNGMSEYSERMREEKQQQLSRIIQNAGDPVIEGRVKGHQCPCPSPCPPKPCPTTCSTKCTSTCSPQCTTTCAPKCTTSCPPKCPPPMLCPLPCPTRCPLFPPPCLPTCPSECSTTCSTECPPPCPTTCSTPCPCPQPCPECDAQKMNDEINKAKGHQLNSAARILMAQYGTNFPFNINAFNQRQYQNFSRQLAGTNMSEHQMNGISGRTFFYSEKDAQLSTNSSGAMDFKSKKHRDSFFSRLRSKFHKGIITNGTGSMNNSLFPSVRPIIRFNQGPPGHVWHVSHELSVSSNNLKHAVSTSSTTSQPTLTQPNQTKSVIHIDQPKQPNQPIIPLTQPPASQPQPSVNQTNPFGNQTQPPGTQLQPPMNQAQSPANQPQPPGYQIQPPVNQPQPPGNQSQAMQPGCQPQPSACQPMPSGNQPVPSENQPMPSWNQPQPSGCQPQPSQCQPQPSSNQPQPQPPASPTVQCFSANITTCQTQCQTKQTIPCYNPNQTSLPNQGTQSLIPTQPGKTGNNLNQLSYTGLPTTGQQVGQPLKLLHYPSPRPQNTFFHRSHPQIDVKLLQAQTHQLTAQVQHVSPTLSRLQDHVWQPPNLENPWWQHPKHVDQAPMWTHGQLNQPQIYPNQVIHTPHLRIQPNIPSARLAEQPNSISQNVAHKIENSYHNVNRLPRTSFRWGKRHKGIVKNSNIPTIGPQGSRGARKIKWPLNPNSIYDKIARVRRYLKYREKRRGLKI